MARTILKVVAYTPNEIKGMFQVKDGSWGISARSRATIAQLGRVQC